MIVSEHMPSEPQKKAPATAMRVVITNPYVWPHVRRGSERLLDNLSRDLHARGHQVSVMAMAPDDASEMRDGIPYQLIRQRMGSRPRQFNCLHDFAFRLQRALGSCDADVVFCLNYFDAWAALRARQRFGKHYKVVFMSVGIPTRAYFRAVPLDAWFMRKVMREADEVLVLSQFAHDSLRRDFGADSVILPPPVMTDQFVSAPTPSGDSAGPHILFVGDVDEARKGAAALCAAFVAIKATHPAARLAFAGRVSDARRDMLLASLPNDELRQAISFTGLGQVGDLPKAYQQADVTVLPAVWEAFGLVLVESLAAGTPVVGALHGGIPDIIDSPLVGQCFDPAPFDIETHNIPGLQAAILAVLARGKSEAVRAACQARAHAFSWAALGPVYEQRLLALINAGGGA